jgi:hypothetical protein
MDEFIVSLSCCTCFYTCSNLLWKIEHISPIG